MDEREGVGPDEDVDARHALRDGCRGRLVEPRDRSGVGEGAAVEDGHGARERDGVRPERRHPAQDAIRDARDRGAPHGTERVDSVPVAGHGAQQLVEEERIAGARARARRAERVVGPGQRRADDRRDGLPVQRAEAQPDGLGLRDERVEQLGGGARLVRPQRHDERDREVADALREIRQRAHG